MSEEKNAEILKRIEALRRENSELQENCKRDVYHEMIRLWTKIVLVIFVCVFVGFGLAFFLANFLPSSSVSGFDASRFQAVVSDVFIATITIDGVVTGFIPIISFFFVDEIKEELREIKEGIEEAKKGKEGEEKELLETKSTLFHVMNIRLKSAVIKYTRTYIIVSIFTQITLVTLFIFTTLGSTLTAVYGMIDIEGLEMSFTGILPVINVALYQPSYKLVSYVVPARIETRIEPDE